eukprot:jgi/Galph1/4031/GphlegSOOS_G2663.1
MDIIIHSLYSRKEIFFRELVSNAADALEKLRFLFLKDRSAFPNQTLEDLWIQIEFDKNNRTITIADNGIGMTKEELINNLGVVARSGTLNFLENLKEQKDSSLIGQFGVGFYSAYLVADKVNVITKSLSDRAYMWESHAQQTFTIREYPDQSIERGTKVILHMKDDSLEFLDEYTLRQLAEKYCRFITFPIYLKVESLPEKEDSDQELEDTEGDASNVSIEKVQKNIMLNEQQPTWLKDPSEVKEEEYRALFSSLSMYSKNYITKTHFRAEGEVEFRSILFIPERPPFDFFTEELETSPIRLFLKRVLVSDKFTKDALLPRWLSFILGVVDSDDLPINISRETLQQNRIIQLIRKKLIQKSLEMIRNLAAKEDQSKQFAKDDFHTDNSSYIQFWKQYGKNIKLGVIEDAEYRKKLINLLRFKSSATSIQDDDYTSLKEYVSGMKKDQKFIYYLGGESLSVVKKSPFLEQLSAKNYETLFLIEPIDEYLLTTLTEYEGYKFVDVSKENLLLGTEDEKNLKSMLSEAKKQLKPMIEYLEHVLSIKISRVKVTSRLVDTPCMLVAPESGYSANAERILRAQALANPELFDFKPQQKILEINPNHPLIKRISQFFKTSKPNKGKDEISLILYDLAAISSGYQLEDVSGFSNRMQQVVSIMLDHYHSFLDITSDVDEDIESKLTEEKDVHKPHAKEYVSTGHEEL